MSRWGQGERAGSMPAPGWKGFARGLTSAVCAATTDRTLSLTYDDGPSADTLPLLDVLAEHEVTATFFMLARSAATYPDIARQVVEAGHEVGLHGMDHRRTTTLRVRDERAHLRAAKALLEDVTGASVRWYRPTYGAQRPTLVRAARSAGMDTLIWSAWATDWEPGPEGAVVARAAEAVHPGAVLLLHDTLADQPGHRPEGFAARVGALLLPRLMADGWTFQPASALLSRYPQVRCPWFELPVIGGA